MVPKPKPRVDDQVSIAPQNDMEMCVGFIFVSFSCTCHKQMQLKLKHWNRIIGSACLLIFDLNI